MKKLFSILILIMLVSACSTQGNYNQITSMNNVYPIEMIYFDEKSSEVLGEFPISRKIYGDIIQIIEKQNPKFIILKFFLDIESEADDYLYSVISRYNNVLTQCTTNMESNYEESDLRELEIEGIKIDVDNKSSLLLPNRKLIDGFAGIGMVDYIGENDRYIDYPIFSKVDEYIIPSLGLLIIKSITDDEISYDGGILKIGEKEIELRNGNMKIDISEPKKLYRSHSMIDVLDENGVYNFENKIVIIFIESPEVRCIKTEYKELHNKSEIIADSINSLLKVID